VVQKVCVDHQILLGRLWLLLLRLLLLLLLFLRRLLL